MLSKIIKENGVLVEIFSNRDIPFIRDVRAKQYKILAQTLRVFFNKVKCRKLLKENNPYHL